MDSIRLGIYVNRLVNLCRSDGMREGCGVFSLWIMSVFRGDIL